MTDAVTAAERLAETLHRLGYLIDRHSLPAPQETRLRTVHRLGDGLVDLLLANLHDLNLWAEATDATVTKPQGRVWMHVACSVLGDVPLRMTAFGEALTP
jgi:ABC-type hemin transport system ATPase subunit